MSIIFIAPPLGGKGTQMELLKGFLESRGEKVLEIGTGNFFRNLPDTKVGQMIKNQTKIGSLVDDVWANSYVANLFLNELGDHQVIFDGYPRNIEQGEFLLKLLDSVGRLDEDSLKIVYLHVHKTRLKERLRRRIKTTGRADDTTQCFKIRWAEYTYHTYPLVQFFTKSGIPVIPISGHKTADEVYDDLLCQLGLFE